MKKYSLLFALLLLLFAPEISQAASADVASAKAKTQIFGGGRKNKDGQYRKRKGFLWGLFKGKNQCDCPKH